MERGKPPIYNPEKTPGICHKLALLGATNKEMADVLEVNVQTIDLWMRKHPEFRKKVNEGKTVANSKVAHALYKKATGFYYEEERAFMYKGEIITKKIKKYQIPDAWACMKFLGAKEKEKWTDTQNTSVSNTQINIGKIDLSGFSMEELTLMRKIGLNQHMARDVASDN